MNAKSNFFSEIIDIFTLKMKKPILKYGNISNTNKIIYFYEDCFMIVYANKIIKHTYNKISYVNENDNSFFISIKADSIIIDKKTLDNTSIKFLQSIIKNYKKIDESSGHGNNVWKSLDISNYGNTVSSIDKININNLEQYYSDKNVKFDIFVNYYFLHLIVAFIIVFILWFPFQLYSISSLKLIHLIVLIPCAVFIGELLKMKKNIKVNLFANLKFENKIKLFFFKKSFVIKTDDMIACYEYKNMKIIFENDKLIFIKFKFLPTFFGKKSVFYPIIIDKSMIKKEDIDFIYEVLKNDK